MIVQLVVDLKIFNKPIQHIHSIQESTCDSEYPVAEAREWKTEKQTIEESKITGQYGSDFIIIPEISGTSDWSNWYSLKPNDSYRYHCAIGDGK